MMIPFRSRFSVVLFFLAAGVRAASGQVIVGRVDVTPSCGSFEERNTAVIAGQTPGAGLYVSSGNCGDWAIGIGASPARPKGRPLPQEQGVLMVSLNELAPQARRGGVEACGKLTAGQASTLVPGSCWVAGFSNAGGAEANYDFAFAWFPFAQGWIAAHVARDGRSVSASGPLPAGTLLRRRLLGGSAGEIRLVLPGINAQTDGALFVISGENGDNVTAVAPEPDGAAWRIRIADEAQDYRRVERAPWSFVFLPYRLRGLVAGRVRNDGRVLDAAGAFGVRRVARGRYEITIPGRTGKDGVLLVEIAQWAGEAVEDNTIAWAWDDRAAGGRGAFVVETYDLPAFSNQSAGFYFAFLPYKNALNPHRLRGEPFSPGEDWAAAMLAADALRARKGAGPRRAWWTSAWPALRRAFPAETARLIRDFGERGDLLDFDLAAAQPRLVKCNAAMRAELGAAAQDLPPYDETSAEAALRRYGLLARRLRRRAAAAKTLWRLAPDLAALLDYPRARTQRLRRRLESIRDSRPDLADAAKERLRALDAFDTRLARLLVDLARGRKPAPATLQGAADALRSLADWADRQTGWTTYGGDNARSFVRRERVRGPLAVQWRHIPAARPDPAWPPPAEVNYDVGQRLSPTLTYDRAYHPIIVDGRVVYAASGSDCVVCLSAADGRELWRFPLEGPPRLPPAAAYGRVYVGADDGALYCLDLHSGRLRWRHRAGGPLRLVGNGRLISETPVRSGLCVDRSVVYFTAGLFPRLGVYLCAVDARTGREIWKKPIALAAQGFMLLSPERIFVPTGRTPYAMFRRRDAASLGRLGRSDSWGKSLPGGACALVVNETILTGPGEGGALFGFNLKHSEMVVKTNGRRVIVDGLAAYVLSRRRVAAFARADYLAGRKPRRLWTKRCPPCFSMLKCGDLLFLGGSGELLALDAATGEQTQRVALPGGRVEGLAECGGRVFASLSDGGIVCLAASQAAPTKPAPRPTRQTVSTPTLRREAEALARWCEFRQGWILLLGDRVPAGLAPELARASGCRVVVAARDEKRAAALRMRYANAGWLGVRVTAHAAPGPRLPYRPYLFNLIVVMGQTDVSGEEIYRVLHPTGGRAAAPADSPLARAPRPTGRVIPPPAARGLGFAFRRGPLPGAGRWTDAYADPQGTVCSNDAGPFASFRLLWFGRPGPRRMADRHWKGMPPLYANGSLYVFGQDYLACVDAYNGALRWERDLPGAGRVGVLKDCGCAALGANDRLYVAADANAVVVDGKTGKLLARLPVARFAKADAWWGFVGLARGRLIGSATRPGAELDPSRRADYRTIWYNNRPVVVSESLFAARLDTFAPAWRYRPARGAIVNPSITLLDGKVFFIESANPATRAAPRGQALLPALWKGGPRVTALDAATGERVWSAPVDLSRFRNTVFMQGADGVLVLTGSYVGEVKGKRLIQYQLIGLRAADGKELWRNDNTPSYADRVGGGHGEQTQHPVIVRGVIYGPGFARRLRTGEPYAGWKWSKSAYCSPMSASLHCAFSRGRGVPTAFDLADGRRQPLTRVTRPGCWYNILPAGGIVLVPEGSSGCTCGYSLQTSLAFFRE